MRPAVAQSWIARFCLVAAGAVYLLSVITPIGAGAPSSAAYEYEYGKASIEIRPRSMSLVEGTYCVALSINILQGKVSAGNVGVNYRTRNGAAKSPQDFDGETGAVTFPAGTDLAPIDICITDDNENEPRESFRVELFDPVNAVIEPAGKRTTVFIKSNSG